MNRLRTQITNFDGWFWPNTGKFTYDVLSKQQSHKEILLPLCAKTDTMIQAGGNCGIIVYPFCEHFKNIYTFEPDPINFLCLNMNLDFKHVHKFQACLGSERTQISLENVYTDSNGDNGAFNVSKVPGNIPVIRIDDLNLKSCDLIMLDVEGYEQEALNGALETINKFKPVLCLEIYPDWLARYGATVDSIMKIITSLNYVPHARYHSDIIFVQK
jgi:FkbM family methyltransferase